MESNISRQIRMNKMKKIRLFESLSWKQTRLAVITALLFGVVINSTQIFIDYIQEQNSIKERINLSIQTYFQSASRIAFNLDSKLANDFVNDLMANNIVTSILLGDPNNPLAEAHKPIVNNESIIFRLHTMLFPEHIQFKKKLNVAEDPNEYIGYLILNVDTFALFSEFRQRSFIVLISGILKSLLLSVVLVVIFNRYLTQPIIKLNNNLESISFNTNTDANSALITDKNHQRDELGLLITGINALINKITIALEEKSQKEQELKDYQAQLESTIDKRTDALNKAHKELRFVLDESNSRMDEERRRISRKLHDSVNQKLIFSKLELQRLKKISENDLKSSEYISIISGLINNIENVYSEIRDIIKFTRIEILDSLGLTGAIEELVEYHKSVSNKTEFILNLDHLEVNQIPEKTASNVYHIFQEILLNIVKHAQSTQVTVSIKKQADNIYLASVKDNGIGIQSSPDHFGIGLIDMRERAKLLGSELKIESSKNKGTSIEFYFSLIEMPK